MPVLVAHTPVVITLASRLSMILWQQSLGENFIHVIDCGVSLTSSRMHKAMNHLRTLWHLMKLVAQPWLRFLLREPTCLVLSKGSMPECKVRVRETLVKFFPVTA